MPTGKTVAGAKALVLCALTLGCGSSGKQSTGTGGQGGTTPPSLTETTTFTTKVNTELDLLFVIDNSASTTVIQSKLNAQLPAFLNLLESQPNPPDLHIAVVSSDMGAPGDSTRSIGCTAQGDGGEFHSTPSTVCTTTLSGGATYISDGDNGANFTDPIASVLQCVAQVGQSGCGFTQPLAALDRALGTTPPSANAGFLRPNAYLGVILLADEDDCSAPTTTQLFSLNGGQQNIANPLGPIALYRCNQYGHLCTDPGAGTAVIMPPLPPPADSQGTASAPTLDLDNCTSNDTGLGLLTPVSQFVTDIKALKADPENQILVSAIVGPPSPYTVAWVPEVGGQNTQPGELWPEVEHSCGAAGGVDVNPESTMHPTDNSYGDPGVRLAAFANSFSQSVLVSVCDASYAASMQMIAAKVGQMIAGQRCLTWTIQNRANGEPDCSVTAHLLDAKTNTAEDVAYQNCDQNGNTAPCWSLSVGVGSCTGETLTVTDAPTAPSTSVTVSCQICEPGATVPGC